MLVINNVLIITEAEAIVAINTTREKLGKEAVRPSNSVHLRLEDEVVIAPVSSRSKGNFHEDVTEYFKDLQFSTVYTVDGMLGIEDGHIVPDEDIDYKIINDVVVPNKQP